jgi:hypothetical protein
LSAVLSALDASAVTQSVSSGNNGVHGDQSTNWQQEGFADVYAQRGNGWKLSGQGVAATQALGPAGQSI